RRHRPRRHGAHRAQSLAHGGERGPRRAGVRRRGGAVPPVPRRARHLRPSLHPRAPPRLGRAAGARRARGRRRRGGARRAGAAARLARARARDAGDALPARHLPRLELCRAGGALPRLSAAGALDAAAGQRRKRERRAALAHARQRRLLRPAQLPAVRFAAPRGLEGGGAHRRHADQAVHGRERGRALARLAAAARRPRARAAPVAHGGLGARRGAQRRELRPAAARHRDRAVARRAAPRGLPAGPGPVQERMKALPHPLSAEMRVITLRDLVWLAGSLAIVAAPHAMRAPWWLTLLTLCLFAWRFYYAITRTPLPSRWLILAVAFVGLTGVWIEYRTLFGRQPGVVLLLLFAGLKLLESRTHRDGAAAAFLGYFLIITNFLYTQSIPTAALMACGAFAITATLVGFSAPQRPSAANLRTAGLLVAHAVPAALVLFLLFPRVQGPLWGMPQDAFVGMTGLSETMAPGNLSRLAQSDAIAFRAAFEGEAPPQAARYWRGPVLWDFDGRTW